MTTDLYEFPTDHVGRKTYVNVRGHSRSVPKYKTYVGTDRHNYVLPEYGGEAGFAGEQAPTIMPDKAGYLSPMDRTVVEGRSAHREHMRKHNVVEAGDMKLGSSRTERAPMGGVRSDIQRAMQELNR